MAAETEGSLGAKMSGRTHALPSKIEFVSKQSLLYPSVLARPAQDIIK